MNFYDFINGLPTENRSAFFRQVNQLITMVEQEKCLLTIDSPIPKRVLKKSTAAYEAGDYWGYAIDHLCHWVSKEGSYEYVNDLGALMVQYLSGFHWVGRLPEHHETFLICRNLAERCFQLSSCVEGSLCTAALLNAVDLYLNNYRVEELQQSEGLKRIHDLLKQDYLQLNPNTCLERVREIARQNPEATFTLLKLEVTLYGTVHELRFAYDFCMGILNTLFDNEDQGIVANRELHEIMVKCCAQWLGEIQQTQKQVQQAQEQAQAKALEMAIQQEPELAAISLESEMQDKEWVMAGLLLQLSMPPQMTISSEKPFDQGLSEPDSYMDVDTDFLPPVPPR